MISLEDGAAEKHRSEDERLLNDAGLAELKQLSVQKLQSAASAGRLAQNRDLMGILYRWKTWAGPEEARAFCGQMVRSQDGAVQLLVGFLLRSTSHGMGDYVTREHWSIKLANIEEFVSWETIEQRLDGLALNQVTEEQKKAVEAFRKAVSRRRSGRPEGDRPLDHDDED